MNKGFILLGFRTQKKLQNNQQKAFKGEIQGWWKTTTYTCRFCDKEVTQQPGSEISWRERERGKCIGEREIHSIQT